VEAALARQIDRQTDMTKLRVTFRYIQGVSGGIVNIVGGGSMDYSDKFI
jgi:hypothetical protein